MKKEKKREEIRRVYLDNNATTLMRPEVRKAFAKEIKGNASSMYASGRLASEHIKDAREKVAKLVGTANSNNVIFTSGATESNNTVLRIAVELIKKKGKGRILSTKIEHPSLHEAFKKLRVEGVEVYECSVDRGGNLDLDEFERELKKGDVVLSSVMTVNNEMGTIEPVKQACNIAHDYGSLFHTDATQAMGKVHFDFDGCEFDYASISAHKFYGPKGVGALVVQEDAPFSSFMIGGHQESGKRAGTYNNNAIYAMGIAAELALDDIDKEAEKLLVLRNSLKEQIEKVIPAVSFNIDENNCVPGTLNVSFRGVEGESILLLLDFHGIEVSTGSACATGSLEPSYVLLACGVPIEDAHSSIRFSFGRGNSKKDVAYVMKKLPLVIEKLREISTRSI